MKKKMIAVMMIAVMVLGGCGNKKNTATNEAVSENQSTNEAEQKEEDNADKVEDTESQATEVDPFKQKIEEAKESAKQLSVEITENKDCEILEDTSTSDGVDEKSDVKMTKPLVENKSGKVQIQCISTGSYKYNSYLITSKEGESIAVDPTSVVPKDTYDMKVSAIVCTHTHSDHVCDAFTNSYEDAKKLIEEKGTISTNDFTITMIPSSHNSDDINEKASNYLALIEVDGLRIVHMGDCGQTILTDEQLEQLGDIDICFTQFTNSYSGLQSRDGKAPTLIKQLNPKIIIPTHYVPTDLNMFTYLYGTSNLYNNVMTIDKDSLPEERLHLCRILNNISYND